MASNTSIANACIAQAISYPQVYGIRVTSIQASPVTDYSFSSYPLGPFTKSEFSGLNFCNVSVSYTHPGEDDNVTVVVYLPQTTDWNGRFMGAGGGGWSAGQNDPGLIPAVDDGFAVAQTNAGGSYDQFSSAAWALKSPGNPDVQHLVNFASRALHEMTVIGKSITESYFGQPPAYSYWTGCSQGGRQGHMMAQRYPDDYDGIAARAPAINWGQLFSEIGWPRQVMYELGYAPPECETKALVAAAIDACDALDGIVDGVISDLSLCKFDPTSLVGQVYDCNGTNSRFTTDGIKVVQSAWTGQRTSEGEFVWYGLGFQSTLIHPGILSTVGTTCSASNNCTPSKYLLSNDWFRLWIAANPDFDMTNLTRAEYNRLTQLSIQQYDSIIGTSDPDLASFRDAGGKMITWHGTADFIIPWAGTVDYNERVRDADANIDEYYRLFLAPGMDHCIVGPGLFPHGILSDLMNWVEESIPPQQIIAQNAS